MRERKIKVLKLTAAVLTGGLAYGMFYIKTGIGIPCLFYSFTGLYCPGCGITRLLTFLLQGKIREAMESNYALFFLLPVIVLLLLEELVTYVRTGKAGRRRGQAVMLYIMIGILCLYAAVRNISGIF